LWAYATAAPLWLAEQEELSVIDRMVQLAPNKAKWKACLFANIHFRLRHSQKLAALHQTNAEVRRLQLEALTEPFDLAFMDKYNSIHAVPTEPTLRLIGLEGEQVVALVTKELGQEIGEKWLSTVPNIKAFWAYVQLKWRGMMATFS